MTETPTPAIQLRTLERTLEKALHELRAMCSSTELAMGDADQTMGDRWAALHRLQEQSVVILSRVVPLVERVPMSYRGYPAYRECLRLSVQLKREALAAQRLHRDHAQQMGLG
ncbi:hypothetical protein [Stomatohabitans albus]|uniref:hypothetical protein n=1 Tax=Stomatohabitans albus TaxID=3110766 RepID=UPI00300CB7C1